MMERSLLRVITILLCSLIIWGLLFMVSWSGFHELRATWDVMLNGKLLATLFDFLFLALTLMLTFSTAIILYSSLFASAETSFLLAGPVPEDRIFAYKYQGAVAFSSWAFILLASPILIAYGIEVEGGAPWYFYFVMPLFFLGFVLLPGSLAPWRRLLLVNFLPRHRKQVLALSVVLVVGLIGWWGVHMLEDAGESRFRYARLVRQRGGRSDPGPRATRARAMDRHGADGGRPG